MAEPLQKDCISITKSILSTIKNCISPKKAANLLKLRLTTISIPPTYRIKTHFLRRGLFLVFCSQKNDKGLQGCPASCSKSNRTYLKNFSQTVINSQKDKFCKRFQTQKFNSVLLKVCSVKQANSFSLINLLKRSLEWSEKLVVAPNTNWHKLTHWICLWVLKVIHCNMKQKV